ncbi:rhamnogalacturonan acetylesterase [Candidatus Sumerlaeota bacterium]|nr:rhamnogalacturonan acetylesterase [Candidatus Sumerlaeota bacterium]
MFSDTLLRVILLLAGVMIVNSFEAQATTVTIGLIGDSTVATRYGWGPAFATRIGDKAQVLNYAKNGATLESLSGKLDELLELKPDYVLIQFGHNDQKKYDTEEYKAKLKSYVDRVKQAGAQAIILSSVTRRNFDENGKIKPREEGLKANLTFYAKAAQEVAAEEQVPFIDLYAVSVAHHNEIGPEASAAYNYNEKDTTHFSPQGAGAIAMLILKELKAVVPDVPAWSESETPE